MLKLKDETIFQNERSSVGTARPANVMTLASILGAIRRHIKMIVVIFAICLGAAIAYLMTAPPRYTASTSLMIDTRKSQIIKPQFGSDPPLDASIIESQAEIIKSDDLLMKVVRDNKLIEDAEFAPQPDDDQGNFWDSWLGRAPVPMSTEALERTVAFAVSRNLSVKRVGLSYVLDIRYVSLSPVRAMMIANAIASGYTNGETESRYDATRKFNSWLKERLAELREQTIAADRALQAFKTDINRASTSAEAQVTLRNLESTVTATKSLYDAYLQRSIDTAQQQDVPTNEARIIKTASIPLKPSSPNSIVILGLAILGASGLSGLYVVAQQARIQTFDTAERVEATTGLRCLGVLPDVAAGRGLRLTRATQGEFDLTLARSVCNAPFDRPFRQLKLELDARCRDTAC
ncbi:GumC family protein, partial [Methylobacterium haplocladii]